MHHNFLFCLHRAYHNVAIDAYFESSSSTLKKMKLIVYDL